MIQEERFFRIGIQYEGRRQLMVVDRQNHQDLRAQAQCLFNLESGFIILIESESEILPTEVFSTSQTIPRDELIVKLVEENDKETNLIKKEDQEAQIMILEILVFQRKMN